MDFNFEIICPYSSMSGYYFQSLLQLFCTHTKKNTKNGGGKVLQESFKENLFFSLFREVVKNRYLTVRLTFSFPCLGKL